MAAVTVNVTPVNDRPTATPYAFQTQEDQTLSLGWGATKDQEGDTVTLLSAGPTTAAGGTASASGDVITYSPPPNFNGTDTFEYVVLDNGKTAGTNDFKRATNVVTVTVLAVNDPPAISIPAPQSVAEDTGLVLTNLMVSDIDAGNAAVRVSFTITNGTLTLAATNGLTFDAGTNGGSQFTFTGTLMDITNVLASVTFLPTTNFNGGGAVRIDADDLGNTGLGGPLMDTKALAITINPVNDLPVVTLLSPTNNATFVSIDVITLEASALDVDGQIIALEFCEGTNRLTTLNSPPFSFAWTNVPLLTNLTNYALYAKASDDQGGERYSQTNWINVRPPGLFKINTAQKMASRFALVITGETGQKYSIETSTNLETWIPLTTVTNCAGTASYEDDLTNNVDRKFYRAKLVR